MRGLAAAGRAGTGTAAAPTLAPTRVALLAATRFARTVRRSDGLEQHRVDIDLERLKTRGFVTPDAPKSQIADEFRVIKRPIIRNARSTAGKAIQDGNLIMVTSALPREGKTFTAVNLALSMAMEIDTTVLLVDGDVAHPELPNILGTPTVARIARTIDPGEIEVSDAIVQTNIENLSVLPAGAHHRRATELLASEQMAACCVSWLRYSGSYRHFRFAAASPDYRGADACLAYGTDRHGGGRRLDQAACGESRAGDDRGLRDRADDAQQGATRPTSARITGTTRMTSRVKTGPGRGAGRTRPHRPVSWHSSARPVIGALLAASSAVCRAGTGQTWRIDRRSSRRKPRPTTSICSERYRQSDWVSEVTPSIRFSEKGARTRLNALFSVPLLLYARSSDKNTVYPSANVLGDVKVVDELFHVEGQLRSRSSISIHSGRNPGFREYDAQSLPSSTYRVSPYIQGVTPGNALRTA